MHITPTPADVYKSHLKLFPPLKPGQKLGVNKQFWRMLGAILRVAFPRQVLPPANLASLIQSKTGKEAFLLVLHTFFLVARTVLSVMVARLDGRIVRDLVSDALNLLVCTAKISGISQRQGVSERFGLVVCACDSKYLYQFDGGFQY